MFEEFGSWANKFEFALDLVWTVRCKSAGFLHVDRGVIWMLGGSQVEHDVGKHASVEQLLVEVRRGY